MKCVLTSGIKQLPKWGFEQQEISCNPTTRDPNSLWNVEDNFYPKLPNVSFQNFAPGFISRFIESHAVMLQGNAGLKPKEGEVTSRPWEWPINVRVCVILYYSCILCSDCSLMSFLISSSTISVCLMTSLTFLSNSSTSLCHFFLKMSTSE